jgi:hypothetical protein
MTRRLAYSRLQNTKIIFDQVIYQTGLKNNEIAKLLKAYGCGSFPVYCDSAEPKSIAELKGYGIKAQAQRKGKIVLVLVLIYSTRNLFLLLLKVWKRLKTYGLIFG